MNEQTTGDLIDPINTEEAVAQPDEATETNFTDEGSDGDFTESADEDDASLTSEEYVKAEDGALSYEDLARRDLEELSAKFPEARMLKSITALPNALRYAELRDLGLTPTEAYLATGRLRPASDNRAHLNSKVPKGSSERGSYMKISELNSAREIFSSLSDDEIQRLYKRVNG